MDRTGVWRTIHGERAALADLLEALEPADWDRPSLCEGWRVREVAAHVISSAEAGVAPLVGAMIRARGRFHRLTDLEARRLGARPPAEIVADYRRLDGSRRHPPGTSVLDPLLDVLVHTQDIAVPLGRRHVMPVDAARTAAGRVERLPGFFFPSRRLVAGVRLQATDTAWTAGSGPVVEGPMQALLLLMTGRHAVALPAVTGDGVEHLTQRLATAKR
jgi:uncharacterized protein (TIGR03083 family)